jgi:6-phosphogluconate dehydrogenase (decarboxylating)
MTNMNPQRRYEIGMVGLGVMGRNLLLNMADHGFSVAGYDKELSKVDALRKESADRDICGAENIKDFIGLLRAPRAVMMLVPAGAAVDSVINDLLAHVQPGDLIIDAGNSYFKDTNLRARNLTGKGIQFLGVGVSGGEEGARHGPSIGPGGPKEAYERVRPVFEAAAAKVNGDPCVSRLGPGSAEHFVKMVHNGIEYGVMQLIAETYDLLKRGFGLNDNELHDVYSYERIDCLVAMEPMVSFDADEIRNKKVDVLHAVRPIHPDAVHQCVVRGQYGQGLGRRPSARVSQAVGSGISDDFSHTHSRPVLVHAPGADFANGSHRHATAGHALQSTDR